jgi:hypothetical protein
VEFNRFLHYHDPATMTFHVAAAAANGPLRLWLSDNYLSDIRIENVSPPPERVEAGAEGQTFVFPMTDPARPTRISIHFKAESRWQISGRVGIVGKEALAVGHFVYP